MSPEAMDQIEAQITSLRTRCMEMAEERDRFARLWRETEDALNEQCDVIEDLRKALRSRDLMIEELRSLIGGAATQRPTSNDD